MALAAGVSERFDSRGGVSAQLEVLRMRRFVPFLFPTLIALVSAGLLVAAQRSDTLKAQVERIKKADWLKEADWLKPIVARRDEVSEVLS